MIEASDPRRLWILWPHLWPGPSLLHDIVSGQKEDLGIRPCLALPRCLFRRSDQQSGSGLWPASKVKEVIVLPESVQIIGPFGLNRGKKHDYTAIGLPGQGFPAGAIVRVRLAVKDETG